MTELKRGDIVLYGERGEYTGKLRPGVVVQRESTLEDAPSVTLCGFTSFPMPTHGSRIAISPSAENGLDQPSFIMIDKIVSISRPRVREIVGKLNKDEVEMMNTALRRWLEL